MPPINNQPARLASSDINAAMDGREKIDEEEGDVESEGREAFLHTIYT